MYNLLVLKYILIITAVIGIIQNNIAITVIAIALAVSIIYNQREPFASAFENDEGETIATRGFELGSEAPLSTSVVKQWDNSKVIDSIMTPPVESVDGDTLLYQHSKHMAEQSREAILNRARFTSDNFRPIFQEELDEEEHRDWWDSEYSGHDMIKDGINYTML